MAASGPGWGGFAARWGSATRVGPNSRRALRRIEPHSGSVQHPANCAMANGRYGRTTATGSKPTESHGERQTAPGRLFAFEASRQRSFATEVISMARARPERSFGVQVPSGSSRRFGDVPKVYPGGAPPVLTAAAVASVHPRRYSLSVQLSGAELAIGARDTLQTHHQPTRSLPPSLADIYDNTAVLQSIESQWPHLTTKVRS